MPFQPPLNRAVLVRQLALLRHANQHRLQLRQLAGLGQIIEHALTQRSDRRLHARFAGKHDRLGIGRVLAGTLNDLDAVQPRHVEVHDDAVVRVAIDRGGGGRAIGADCGLVTHAR